MNCRSLIPGSLLVLGLSLGNVCAQTNVYSTANVYTNVAPPGTGWMRGKLWGAGGGNGNLSSAGGGGAFAAATMAASPGDTYVTVVGQQGAPSGNSLGGAGSGNTQGGAPGYLGDYNGRGQGGQATSLLLFTSNRFVLKALAGAGGGAGFDANGGPGGLPGVNYSDAIAGQPGWSGIGGAGGGTGNPGSNYAGNAATIGFAALNQAGGNGGDASNWSGGGGGGYGGGGGGGGGTVGAGAGGGGGGSYGQTTLHGNGTQPGNTSDSDYVAQAGTAQNDGLAVLIFAPCGPLSVTDIGLANATVIGSLNPNNLPSAWYIVYGTTTNYGNTTPPQTVSAGAGTVIVSQTLSNLASSTLYHYRLVLANSNGVASGVDSTFITEASTTSYLTAGVYTNFAPLGTTGVTFKLWGAGGGGGNSGGATGGGGAFSTVTLPAQVGDTFLIVVGQRGASSDHNLGGFGTGDTEGGAPGYLGDYNGRGQGGQGSSVFKLSNNLLVLKAVAGGGGGSGFYSPGGGGGQAGTDYNDASGGQPGSGGLGGAGGGAGSPGTNYSGNATTAGIAALNLAAGNGGYANNWSGGGGGGYGGGGGGGGGTTGNGAGGGGGGSYGDQVIAGNGQQPPNTSDTNYVAGASQGGNPLAAGSDGLAVVLWQLVNAGPPPTLTSQPQSQTLPTGATAIFSVTATGVDPLNYQWTFNGTNIPGATLSVLVIPNVQPTNSGVYQVAVSDIQGTTVSVPATLDVLPLVLADYTFEGTGDDAVSNSYPMQLSNTAFVNGTLFLNGLYSIDNTNGFTAIATINSAFSYNSFTVALDFYPLAFGGNQDTILMGGTGYRWLGYDYNAGRLEATWNNHASNHVFTNSVLVTNQWQKLIYSVDLVNDRIITFLNGNRLEDIILPPGFQFNVQGTPNEPNEKDFTFTDYSIGHVFYGYADNLMVFGGALSAAEMATLAGGPPLLLTQPQSQLLTLGASAQFSVLAAGPLPLSYQWLFDEAAIPGATNTSYSLASVQFTDQGIYQAVVTDPYGSTTSSVAVLTLQAPPVIAAQPQSQTVAVGAAAILSVLAVGGQPLSYQWYFNGAVISGATNSTLVFPSAYFANGGHYQVIVSNAFGTAASSVATLSVITMPLILQPPDSAQVAVGDTAVFNVLASSSGALNYQWFLEGSPLFGATQSSLTITNAQFTDAGNYSVLVSNLAGAVLSPDATLLVLPAVAPPPVLATYSVQMQTGLNLIANQLDRGGNSLAEILPVVPNGTVVSKYDNLNGIWGQATYSNSWGQAGILSLNPGEGAWLRSPTNFSVSFLGTPHTSNIPLSIPSGATWLLSRQTNAPGTYENIVGTVPTPGAMVFQWISSNATFAAFTYTITGWSGGIEPVAQVGESLWIAPTGGEPVPTPVRPSITQQPLSITLGLGGPALFTVAASGSQPLNYQWRLNGNAIPGATTTILSIDSVQPANAGNYDVVVNNAIGITASDIASLTISNLVTLPFADDFENAGTLGLAVVGTGFGQNVGATLEPGEPTPLDLPGGASVWLRWVAPADGVSTFTTAGSDFDTIMAAYILSGPLSISNLTSVAADDDSAAFLCSLINFNASAGTTYFLQVDGFHGATGEIHLSWSFVPTATTPPVIVTQPQSQTVVAGSNLTLVVVVQPGPPLSYQWFSNNIVMPGETNSTLQLNPVQVGIYVVGVTNTLTGAGLLSAAADIQVIIPGLGQRGNPVNVHSEDKFLAATDLTPPDPNVPHDPATASGFTDTQTFSTVNATADPTEPAHCGYTPCKSVWNSYSNQVSGTLTIDTRGTTFNAILEVYTGPGDSFATLVPVACSANHGAAGESVTFSANGGTTYWVVVDGVNCASGNVTLNYNLVAVPTFTASPVSRTVAAGSPVTLSGTVVGAPALHYQWRFNGTNIAGATGSTLTLNSFQAANQGNYSVVCVNNYGSVTSLTAQVLLNNPRFINTLKSSSSLQTTFVGISYTNYIIEASSNLTTWFPIKTNSSAIGVFNFSEPLPLAQPQRFYRGRQR